MYDVDDDELLDSYLPTSLPRAAGLAAKPTSSPHSNVWQDVRKTVPHIKSEVSSEVSVSSPRIFSPAGYSPAIQSQSRSYASRTRSKDVFFRYNCKETTVWEPPKSNDWIINVNPFGIPIFKPGFKYMFQRTADMSRTMDEMISNLGASILEYYKLEDDQDLKDSSVEDVNYVGRIHCEGKLSIGSTFFEGTREASKGRIVTLDLSQLEECFLFPGQVLALSGKNSLGECVLPSKMFLPRSLPFPDKPIQIDSSTGPLRILVAAGPYTTTDSLLYEPLADFLDEIEQHRPQVCIMIGPFIDASHPMIETGQVADTFEEIFNKQMSYLSERVMEIDPNCKLILVPTSKDVHHHPIYPTPPYVLKEWKNIIALPDPAMVSIGGVMIGITSTDILKHLSSHELALSTINADRMGRIARHLLSQSNFYPLYPPDESIPLDVVHWAQNAQMGCTPHILILPSDLRHFIKDVDGTVVLNPERLTKGLSGGTFARLELDLSDQNKDDGFQGPIADYVKGEIIKI